VAAPPPDTTAAHLPTKKIAYLLHCTSNAGLLVFGSILYAKLLAIPLVVSYHTHVPEYIPK
jgi:hypothetical protein